MKKYSVIIVVLLMFHAVHVTGQLPNFSGDPFHPSSNPYIKQNLQTVKGLIECASEDEYYRIADKSNKVDLLYSKISDGVHPGPVTLGLYTDYTCLKCGKTVTFDIADRDVSTCTKKKAKSKPVDKANNNIEAPRKPSTGNDKGDSLVDDLIEAAKKAANPMKPSVVQTYPVPENYSRYSSSPCFNKLGYSPYRSADDLEKMYCDCEREYYINLFIKIGLGILLISGVGYMVYLSQKRRKKEEVNTGDNTPKADA